MKAYFHDDPRIQEWINQIVEKIFTVCLLTGIDSDAEFQKGCQIVIKLTSIFQSEFLMDGVKQLLEQRVPDERVINCFPAFQATMDGMLRESLLMVTDSQKKEALNSLNSNTESTKEISIETHDSHTERRKEVSNLEFITHSVIPALTTLNIPYPVIQQAKVATLALADALIQAETQAKVDAQALAELVAQVDALTHAEMQAKADSLMFADALAHAETQAKADALTFADALAHADAQEKADALLLTDALAKVDELTQAEKQAKADALTFADALAHANGKFKAVTEVEPDPLIKVPALVSSVYSKLSQAFRPTQDSKQVNLLKRVLSDIFPKSTVYWNKNLMGQTFLVQVEDMLICIHDPEHPCNLKKYNKDGWKVLVCSAEDLTFPRRLERGIRHIQRSVRT